MTEGQIIAIAERHAGLLRRQEHRCIGEALRAAIRETAESDLDTAWLIESENGHYIGTQGKLGTHLQWTPDVNAALRFARKCDAESMIEVCKRMGIGFHNDAKGATEHGWYRD